MAKHGAHTLKALMRGAIAAASPGSLPPVPKKAPWVASGLALQLVGAAAPAAYVLDKARQMLIASGVPGVMAA